jgi:GNAT superfamily N-acetyltransferase
MGKGSGGNSMDSISIRPCEAGDLPVVLDLLVQLSESAHGAPGFKPKVLSRLFVEMEQSPGFYHNLVAVCDNQVAGFISMVFYKTLFHEGGTALINELVVSQAFRGRGIGRALVAKAKDEALARGMDEIEVGTEYDNLPARSFYQKCGFDQESVLLGLEFD